METLLAAAHEVFLTREAKHDHLHDVICAFLSRFSLMPFTRTEGFCPDRGFFTWTEVFVGQCLPKAFPELRFLMRKGLLQDVCTKKPSIWAVSAPETTQIEGFSSQ